jgi:tRNA dimethylallyltransferase
VSGEEGGRLREQEAAPHAIAIVGPTATGKTDLSIAVAQELGGEIVSVDSRQAYRDMAIGTAAPDRLELEAVPHHGVGFLGPEERFSAGSFARLARGWIRDIRDRQHIPILAGGTGFFLRALLEPVFREPPMDSGRRESLKAWLHLQPTDALTAWAGRLDPQLKRRLAAVDRQRAARSVELTLLTGWPLSWWLEHGQPEAPAISALIFVLTLPAEEHRTRIASRTERMVDSGWIEEAVGLRDAGLEDAPALNALGYRTVLELADGGLTREQAVQRINRQTWAYARRQRTWFRHQLPESAVSLDASQTTRQLALRIVEDWRKAVRVAATRPEAHSAGTGR